MRRCIRDERGRFAKHNWLELVEYKKGGGHRECSRCGHKNIYSGFDLALRRVYLPELAATIHSVSVFERLAQRPKFALSQELCPIVHNLG